MYVLLGACRSWRRCARAEAEEEEYLKAQLHRRLASGPGWFTRQHDALKGFRRNHRVLRLYQLAEMGGLLSGDQCK